MSAESKTSRRSSFTLLELMILLVCLGSVGWVVYRAAQHARKQALRSHARTVLRKAGIKMELNGKQQRPILLSDGRPMDRELLPQIALFDEVEKLSLVSSFLTDDDVRLLAPLTKLRRLNLRGSLITDAGLEKIASTFPNLESLSLSFTKIRGPGLKHLKSLKQLRELRVANNEITDAALPELLSLSQLERLDVQGTWLSDAAKQKLNHVRIKERHRYPSSLSQAFGQCQPFLRAKSAVDHLPQNRPDSLKVVIPPDGRITRLRYQHQDLRNEVDYRENWYSRRYRMRFPALQYLNLSQTRFDYRLPPAFGAMTDLRELNIVASGCGDVPLRMLKFCTKLKTLDARLCRLTNDSLAIFGQLPELKTLKLGQNHITDDGLMSLVSLKKLQHLELDSCDVTDEGIQVLTKLPSLRYLSLSRSYATRDGAARLQKILPKLKVKLAGVNAVAATNELVGQFNKKRESSILQQLREAGISIQIEGSYGRAIAVRFQDGCTVTDREMKLMGRLTGLRDFRGQKPGQVTSKGVRELAELEELKYLYLQSAKLDALTLDELLRFRFLERAYLYGTSISEEAVEKFQKDHPEHEASWNSEYIRIFFNRETP